MQSIDRIMKIVKVFIEEDPNRFYSVTDLSKKCNLPISSMHRILNAMIKHEMIHQDAEGKLYGIGTIWLEYGLKVYDTMDYISVLRPELEKLMREVQASVYLTRPIGIGYESIVIERIDCTNQTIRAHDKLGLRTPMHIGATNLSMLAHMAEQKRNKLLSHLIPDKEKENLSLQLSDIKLQGYSLLKDDRSEGISTVAAPILNHYGNVVGAVNIRVKNSELRDDNKEQIIDSVINTANEISWKSGH